MAPEKIQEFVELGDRMRRSQKLYASLHKIDMDRKVGALLAMNELQKEFDKAILILLNKLKNE